MPPGFNRGKITNNVCNQLVARVLPHPAHGWIGWYARTFLSAPPLPDPLPHSKQWRRGGQGVLDGGWFSMAGWNFGWLARYLIEFGRANPSGIGRPRRPVAAPIRRISGYIRAYPPLSGHKKIQPHSCHLGGSRAIIMNEAPKDKIGCLPKPGNQRGIRQQLRAARWRNLILIEFPPNLKHPRRHGSAIRSNNPGPCFTQPPLIHPAGF